jgi:hypothetical protein
MQAAGINLISIYQIDLTTDQKSCMDTFASAGIYVLVYLETTAPFDSYPSWTIDVYASYTAIVDFFAQYSNVLGFVVAERVEISPQKAYIDAFVKAATRDVKAYLVKQGYRHIPVGYATLYSYTEAKLYPLTAQYMSCGNSTQNIIDFWAVDLSDTWCDSSNFEGSDYQVVTEAFADFSLPSFISGYGCQLNQSVVYNGTWGRSFAEVESIYGSNMSNVFSGGIVNEWVGAESDGGEI